MASARARFTGAFVSTRSLARRAGPGRRRRGRRPASPALISRLRRSGRATARTWRDIPAGYDGFAIADHRREIDAAYSPRCLAVKIREDDLPAWALDAWLRSRLPRKTTVAQRPELEAPKPPQLPAAPSPDAEAVTRALLAHGQDLASQLKSGMVQFTPDPDANALIQNDPFAFLLAVIADMDPGRTRLGPAVLAAPAARIPQARRTRRTPRRSPGSHPARTQAASVRQRHTGLARPGRPDHP